MKIYFIFSRLSLALIISSLISTNTAIGIVANTTPFVQGMDLLYATLEIIKLKGLSIKEEKGKITKFIDEKKLTNEDQKYLKDIDALWSKSVRIGRSVDLKKHGITLSNEEQAYIFDDISRIKRLHKNINSYIDKINRKPRSKFLYSFKAKDHALCRDLYSHNFITPIAFYSIKKRDRIGHLQLLNRQCTCSHELITREEYPPLTKTLASLITKTDADIFLNYTPTTDEIDTKTTIKSNKKKEKAKGITLDKEDIALIQTSTSRA